jgi:hypothetical protein
MYPNATANEKKTTGRRSFAPATCLIDYGTHLAAQHVCRRIAKDNDWRCPMVAPRAIFAGLEFG